MASTHHFFTFDFLKPYFDIEQSDVMKRLLATLKPHAMKDLIAKPDIYGALMSVFTMVIILVFTMKSTGAVVRSFPKVDCSRMKGRY